MADRIAELAAKVRYHNKLYWIDHKPEISDPEYDQLVEELRKLAPFHAALSEFTEDIGSRAKVTHEVPMLSLDKVFTAQEIKSWANNGSAFSGDFKGLVASSKIDGLSCSLLYEDGKLVRAATRGNGKTGDDVTMNALVVQKIPATIASQKKIEVRGEVYMTRSSFKQNLADFDKRLAAGKADPDERPSNARNFCAGSLKQKDSKVTKERNLSFLAHGLILFKDADKVTSENDLLYILDKLGFETPNRTIVYDEADVDKIIESFDKLKGTLNYDTDGIVWSLNNISTQRKLGFTSHHPRGKIAFKFGREQGETDIAGINWETSRTGRVVPTIELVPIFLGGAKVTYCTGHNAKNILENELWTGARVLMEREVIPYLVKRTKQSSKKDTLPVNCPSCKTKLEWDETKTDLCCPNAGGCAAQLLDYIIHYASRKVCNIMGLGDELIQQLLDKKLISSPADLYTLTPKILVDKLERQGESSAQKMIDAIQERKEQSLATFLYSLGIPGLGNTVSEKLANAFEDLDSVLKASEAELQEVDKVGLTLASDIKEGLQSRSKLINDLLKHVTIIKPKKITGTLTGQTFCLTGHIEFEYGGKKYDSRPDIEDLIKSKGGIIKSVSKGLSFLVAGDDAGSKLDKAKKQGIPIIDGAKLAKIL